MKIWLTVWLLCVLSGGFLFAQTAETIEAETAETAEMIDTETIDTEIVLPKNIITVDVQPTLFFLAFMGISRYIAPENTLKASGVAVQYERQITENASVTGRLEYGGMGISADDFIWNTHSVSAEGHGRYYPGAGVFFLDGTLGYAAIFFDYSAFDSAAQSVAHYFKFGGKLGWRLDFGKPGGFTLEPAIGYYGAVGKRVNIFDSYFEETGLTIISDTLNFMWGNIVQALFISGVRFSLGLGYRF